MYSKTEFDFSYSTSIIRHGTISCIGVASLLKMKVGSIAVTLRSDVAAILRQRSANAVAT